MTEREQEVIWAAGFFDGEGCVSIAKPRKGMPWRYELRLFVAQVKLQPLLVFERLWGGTVAAYNRKSQEHIHQWQTSARQAAKALEEMLPFLQVKTEQAQVGLALQALMGREPHVSETMIAIREDLYQEMRRLNIRRPRPKSSTSHQTSSRGQSTELRLVS